MKKIILLITLLIVLAGCCTYETDQEKRNKIFNECLDRIPNGPQTTKYNDWDEVVAECGEQAYWQSRYITCTK